MVPLVDEDLVEALLDSPWIASDTSDSEAEEEQTGGVVVCSDHSVYYITT